MCLIHNVYLYQFTCQGTMYVSRCKYVYAHAGFQKSATQHMLPAMHVSSNEAQVFTYKQLQFATSNFSPTNLLSSPRRWWQSGAIYRGILPNGNVSIIKQLFEREGEGCKQIDREFRMEVRSSSLIGYMLSRRHNACLLTALVFLCAVLNAG